MADTYMEDLAAIADLEPRLLIRFLEEAAVRSTQPRGWAKHISLLEGAIAEGLQALAPIGFTLETSLPSYVQRTATTMAYGVADSAGKRGTESYDRAWKACCRWHGERAAELLAEAEARIVDVAPPGARTRLSPLARP
jgi:hypothetical protein